VLNTGKTLVRQKEAEHRRDAVALQQVQEKVSVQVKAALVRWQQGQQLVERTNSLTEPIRGQAARMQRLFEAGQADLVKLFQVRRRLIEAENTQLDALWQANQAYADLLAALGATTLLGSVPGQAQESPE
jgi:outer membrane protein TolC